MKKSISNLAVLIVLAIFAFASVAVAGLNPFYSVHKSKAGKSFSANGFWSGIPDGRYLELIHYFKLVEGNQFRVCRSKLKEVDKANGWVTPTGKVWKADGPGSIGYAAAVSGANRLVLDFGELGDGGKTKATRALLQY